MTEAFHQLTYYSATNQKSCVKPLIQDCLYGQIAYWGIAIKHQTFFIKLF